MRHPTVTLNSGLVVANMSSPHTFRFSTGEVLAGCPPEMSRALMLRAVETEVEHPKGWTDISLHFTMSPSVAAALDALEADESIDIVLVPFPVMTACKAAGRPVGKCRVIRSADRVTKTIHSDRFCC